MRIDTEYDGVNGMITGMGTTSCVYDHYEDSMMRIDFCRTCSDTIRDWVEWDGHQIIWVYGPDPFHEVRA